MASKERIEAIRVELREIDAEIPEKERQKQEATSVGEIARIDDELTALRARRTALQLELANLEAAGEEVAPI